MEHSSLKTILLDYINSQEGWVSKGQLALIAENEGYLGETAGRCLRTLAEDKLILVDYYKSKRNVELARYAKIGSTKPLPIKPKIEVINGVAIMYA